MRNRGYQDSDNLYVDNVRIFDSTGNEGWDDTNVLLFEKEQEFLNKDTYMNFYQEIPKSVFNSGPVADKNSMPITPTLLVWVCVFVEM